MAMTAIEKILAKACDRLVVRPGDVVHPDPELVIVHDGYVVAARRELDGLGVTRLSHPSRVMFVTDHEVVYANAAAADRGRAIRATAKDWGVGHFYDVGQGGHGHVFPMETGHVRPGMFLFAYDMHCTNFGAIGALALRTGSEITTVIATGTLWTVVPETVRVRLEGRLAPGVMARDVGFRLASDLVAGRHGIDPDYKALEMGGPGLVGLSLSERVALCNTVTEIGVCAVFFPPDEAILAWCRDRALGPFEPVHGDPDATYAGEIRIDLGALGPQVALPGAPENAVDLGEVAGRPVDHAVIGSCGSGMWDDLVAAASILKGRRVAPGVRLIVTPGTQESARRLSADGLMATFVDAGALVMPPGCGPCAAGTTAPLGAGEVSIATAATNHAGRMGARDAQIYLGSPATVAASAIAGRIADPRGIPG
jgi:3-isopropylmalate/(R)-2-methylmalate dehydratase large subunit